jgi:hypothetical protein
VSCVSDPNTNADARLMLKLTISATHFNMVLVCIFTYD